MQITAVGAFVPSMDLAGLKSFVEKRLRSVRSECRSRGERDPELANRLSEIGTELEDELARGLIVELSVSGNDREFAPSLVNASAPFYGTECMVMSSERTAIELKDGVVQPELRVFTIILFFYRFESAKSLSGEYGVVPLPAASAVPVRIWEIIGPKFGGC